MHLYIFQIRAAVRLLTRKIVNYNFRIKKFHYLCSRNNIVNSDIIPRRKLSMDEHGTAGVPLDEVISQLNSFAELSLAETWDNVGLLIQPYTSRTVEKILLTNDLTEAVMQEALEKNVGMIISYHPPIFRALKSVTKRTWKERLVAACLENRIALYSPHTSFDAVRGGVNDWLASAFDHKTVYPLIPSASSGGSSYLAELTFQKPESPDESLEDNAARSSQDGNLGDHCSAENVEVVSCGDGKLSLKISPSMLPKVMNVFKISANTKVTIPECGMGRMCYLKSPQPLTEIVETVKKHVKIPHLRLALAVGKNNDSLVSTIAICAGSGASVLRGVKADLYLTGEMSHHEVLDAVHDGHHVILCEHSNSERGFLTYFADILANKLLDGKVQVLVSVADKDPLQVV
ncbi:NIF3-like protein 1 isoform X1 [Schistocerca serialis cubense]|uniref:NIF3-like protein 1 isoform X1 n=1 Tax=Schistocerca serialis cubense TaxID=2023355 RepID=UPI00214EA4BB|nr:NIF3-like protein 1 isoform X1 [Schistocerca serialis cubense]